MSKFEKRSLILAFFGLMADKCDALHLFIRFIEPEINKYSMFY